MKSLPHFLLIFLIIISVQTFAQTCNCSTQLLDAKDKIEHNYAGFKDKVNDQTRAMYQRATNKALAQAKNVHQPAYCVALINQWLKFFKDGHIQIGRNRMSDEKESADLQKRIAAMETIHLSPAILSKIATAKSLEGIYTSGAGDMRIAIIRSPNSYRTYAGVILQAKAPWKAGQVILELKEKQANHTIEGITYDRYFIPVSAVLTISPHSIGSWKREGLEAAKPQTAIYKSKEIESRQLSAETLYLKIGSFNQRNAKAIDSIIQSNQKLLEQSPNLILDLRNNGGGSDFTYQPLLPYIYTHPIRSEGTEVLASAGNIKGWAALLAMKDLPAEQKQSINELIEKMKANPGQFIIQSETRFITLDSVKNYPKKIAILMDGNCGSTTEEFLLTAKQSSKVILMGQHSAGVLDYANVRGGDFEGIPYTLYWATTRSGRIPLGKGIDNIGIKPDQLLNPEKDWLIEAQSFLERK